MHQGIRHRIYLHTHTSDRVEHGYKIGEELGFYAGCAVTCLAAANSSSSSSARVSSTTPKKLPKRGIKLWRDLLHMVQSFPKDVRTQKQQ